MVTFLATDLLFIKLKNCDLTVMVTMAFSDEM